MQILSECEIAKQPNDHILGLHKPELCEQLKATWFREAGKDLLICVKS